jgi:hypothetical protein
VRDLINLIRDLTNPNPPLLVCLISIFSLLLETDICQRKKNRKRKRKRRALRAAGGPYFLV